MNPKHQLKVIWIFYKQIVIYNLIFTLRALVLYTRIGSLVIFSVMFWTKVVGFAVITFFFYQFRKNDLYFYYNLGFSRERLLLIAAAMDSILFVVLVTIFWLVINLS